MKQFVSLLAALLCLSTASACIKKGKGVERNHPLTVIVMDTTQALLPNAQVKIQKQVYTTSFDGRVVLKPEQVTSSTFLVSCDGYKPAHAIVKDGPVLIVHLLPDGKKQKEKNDMMLRGQIHRHDGCWRGADGYGGCRGRGDGGLVCGGGNAAHTAGLRRKQRCLGG